MKFYYKFLLSCLIFLCITEIVLAKNLEDVLCSNDVKNRTKIMQCLNNLPQLLKKAFMDCRKSTVPKGGTNDENFRKALCKDKSLLTKMEKCMNDKMKAMKSAKLSKAEQTKLQNVGKCVQDALK